MRWITYFLLAVFLLGCDSNISEAEYVSMAKDSLAQGKIEPATIHLKNALSKNPNNAEARWLLGKTYLDINFGAGAEKELIKARQLGVSEEQFVPLLAKAYIQQQKYTDVLELGNVSSLSSGAAAEFLAARGLAFFGQNKKQQAAQALDAALKKNPDSLYVLVAEARLNSIAHDYETAHRHIKRALEIDPNYLPALSFLGDLSNLENKPEAAIKAYSRVISKRANTDREKIIDQLKRALLLIQLKRYDEAQQEIDKLAKQNIRHPGVNFAQGLLHFRLKRWPEAEESFSRTLSSTSTGNVEALYYLGVAQYRQGKIETADKNLSQYVEANPLRIQGRMGLALVKTQTRDFDGVVDLLRPVTATDDTNVLALNLLANALMKTGKVDEAIALQQRIAELLPESAAVRTELGISQMRMGQQTRGLENLQTAIELDPDYQQADIVLILNYLREKSFKQALQSARAFVARQPDNVTAYNLLGSAYLGLEEREEAEKAFNTALGLEPGNPMANYLLASMALKDANPNKARAYYEAVLKVHENELGALLRLAGLERQQKDTAAMKTLLERAMDAYPEAAQPRRLLAKLYLQEGRPERAIALLQNIPGQDDDVLTLGLLGEAQLASSDYAAARGTFQKLIKLKPGIAQMHFLLAQAYSGLKDQTNMETELSKTLQLSPEHFYARLGLARLQVLKGETDLARENLKRLQLVANDQPDVLALEASIAARSGMGEQALVAARARFQSLPDSGSLLTLVRMLWSADRRQEAIDEMEQWAGSHGDDIRVRMALAAAYIAEDRRSKALAQYEKILKLSPNNQSALNNLAVYLLDSDPDRALELAEKARAVPPRSAAVMDTLAAIWLSKGDVKQARRFNEKSLAFSPGSPTYLYRRAQVLEAEGKPAEAAAELRALFDSQRPFTERDAAREMLKRLSGS